MYTVKVLSEKEFNKLPFKRVQERPNDILGAADAKTNIAYIKDTGYNDVTKHVIAHELDELMAKVSPHEEDGIRYKDFSQSFGNFGASLPGIGKIAKPVLGGIGGIGDFIGGAANKIGLPNFNIGNPSVAQGGTGVAPSNIFSPGGAFSKAASGASKNIGNVFNKIKGIGSSDSSPVNDFQITQGGEFPQAPRSFEPPNIPGISGGNTGGGAFLTMYLEAM